MYPVIDNFNSTLKPLPDLVRDIYNLLVKAARRSLVQYLLSSPPFMIQSSASISRALLRLSIFCKRRSCRGEDLARLLVVEGAEEKGTAKDAFADAFGVWVLGFLVQLLTQTLSLVNTACVLLLTGFQQFLFFFFLTFQCAFCCCWDIFQELQLDMCKLTLTKSMLPVLRVPPSPSLQIECFVFFAVFCILNLQTQCLK